MSDKIRADKQVLFTKIIDSFPGMYITLISIFQSAMVGYLVVEAKGENFIYLWSEWFRIISTCISIIIIWNEYRMGSTVLRWIPDIFDVLIPFLLVFGQVLIISFIKIPGVWFFGFGLLFLFSSFAYYNMFKKAETLVKIIQKEFTPTEDQIISDSLSVNVLVLESVKSFKIKNPILCIFISIFYFCVFFSVRNLEIDNVIVLSFTVVSLVLNMLFLLNGQKYWNIILSATRKQRITD